jgi:hypothetical protein
MAKEIDSDERLKQELLTQGYEYISKLEKIGNNLIAVEATKLFPISIGPDNIVYTPMSVDLELKMNDSYELEAIYGGEPSSENIKSAETFIKMLIESKNLTDASDSDITNSTTHSIRLNAKGQKVIRRNRF